jgi:hypothetical protein
MGAFVGCVASALTAPKPVRADLFGGDIGVLLAQLQQQLQMVSNLFTMVDRAVATAKSVQQTVDRLDTLGKMVTGQAGFGGFLDGLQSITQAGQAGLAAVQHLNIRGGQWKDHIASEGFTITDALQLSIEAAEMDRRLLGSTAQMLQAHAQVANAFGGVQSMSDVANAATSATSVVSTTALMTRQMAQLGGIMATLAQSTGMSGQLYVSETSRQAAEREAARRRHQQLYGNVGRPESAEPVDVQLTMEDAYE